MTAPRAAAVLLLLFLPSCAAFKPLRPMTPGEAATLESWTAQRAQVASLAALADVVAEGPEGPLPGGAFTAVIRYRSAAPGGGRMFPSGRYEITAYSLLGAMLFHYEQDGTAYRLTFSGDDAPRSGDLTWTSRHVRSARAEPLALILEGLTHLADGVLGPPMPPGVRLPSVTRAGDLAVAYAHTETRFRILDGRITWLSFERLHAPVGPVSISFSDVRADAGIDAPYRIVAEYRRLKTRVQIAVSEWALEPAAAAVSDRPAFP